MNIRRNQDHEIQLPEYRKETASIFEFNCAAYAIAETEDQNVYIRVGFAIPPGADRQWEVKATEGDIMGSIDPIQVNFSPDSTTQTIDIPLTHRNFSKVGVYNVTWQWYYRRIGSSSWLQLQRTSHRIYLVLTVPPSPWTQEYAHPRNPWGELLDECCKIAAGCKNAVKATRRITKAIYRNYHLRYDISRGAPRYNFSGYTTWHFELANWINFVLQGNVPQNPRFCPNSPQDYPDKRIVNCYDCAGSLSLMSKVVGANTDYYFHFPFGYLNYVYPIGRGRCNNPFPDFPCSGTGTEVGPNDQRSCFGNHAYTKLNNRVSDATMKDFLSLWERIMLAVLIVLLIIFTFGQADLSSFIDRYNGWLINLSQTGYERITIDTSKPFEDAWAGGQPYLEGITF